MSRHVAMRCACGEKDFDASATFTTVVWDDVLGCMEEWSIKRPYYPAFGPMEVDGGEFHGWWSMVRTVMDAARDHLPTLHEIWEKWPGTGGPPLQGSSAAYFVWRGRTYMTEAVWDRLTARALADGTFETRRDWVHHEPPVVEEVAPELAAALPAGDELALDAETFERIFHATPQISLEHGNLLDFFAGELAELDELARHAGENGEAVTLDEY